MRPQSVFGRLASISPRYSIVLAILSAVACTYIPEQPAEAPKPKPVVVTDNTVKAAETLLIAAVGDLMIGTDFPQDRLPPDEGRGLLSEVEPFFHQADIVFGNLEGTLLDGGEPAKQCRNLQYCYLFRTPTALKYRFAEAGFDVMSLANNHALDFGEEGVASSMATLDSIGIRHSGQIGDVASWEVKGLRIALIAFAPFRGSHNPLDLELVEALISSISTEHDITLVSMHMGAEGEKALRIPFAEEFYHGEARGDVVRFARTAVEAGADVVLGHGPHVPRALELYKDRLIAYSLGNFCTYWGIKVSGKNGYAPILQLQVDAQGRFLRGRIISARQYRPHGPVIDPTHSVARLMAELTRVDFPSTPLQIDEEGSISRLSPLETVVESNN